MFEGWKRKELEKTKNKMEQEKLTLGEQRVRTNFNVGGSSEVDIIKHDTARLIDRLEDLKNNPIPSSEKFRLIALAQTAYEEAAMWAVKAATI